MNVVKIELPFPPRVLSPNARAHWRVKARAVAHYREACGWAGKEALQSLPGFRGPLTVPVRAEVTFLVPNRQRRDPDNLMASLKPAWDGLVDAGLLQDDSVGMLRLPDPTVEYTPRSSLVKVTLLDAQP